MRLTVLEKEVGAFFGVIPGERSETRDQLNSRAVNLSIKAPARGTASRPRIKSGVTV